MLKRVAYTNIGGVYRPYLETIFGNPVTQKSFFSLALVDSGADSILLPLSLGLNIGLSLTSDDKVNLASGVGGAVTFVERECDIVLTNSESSKLFIFHQF